LTGAFEADVEGAMRIRWTVAIVGLLGLGCGGGATDYSGSYDTVGQPPVECNFVRESVPGFPGGL
jgi:hypothetical protein